MAETRLLTIVVAVFLGFPVYFLPAYLAAKHTHPARRGILLWNLLTGWTVVGWFILLFRAASYHAPAETSEEEKNA